MTTIPSTSDNAWVFFIDDSSNFRGSGERDILENNCGLMIAISLRLEFLTTNNQAEYEAVITGISLFEEIGVECLNLRINSQ